MLLNDHEMRSFIAMALRHACKHPATRQTVAQLAARCESAEQAIDAIVAHAAPHSENVLDLRPHLYRKRVTQLLHDLVSLREELRAQRMTS